ncbi:MAG: ATP-dependent helicase, partial [Salinibacterium sp.]
MRSGAAGARGGAAVVTVAERTPTPEQFAAIRSPNPRRTMIAHPGTGKTFALVELIADMLERRDREPECITATTFTRNAAGELRERVIDRCGGRACGVLFGTSHSIALKIVRSRARLLGFPSRIVIYDEQDQTDILKDIIATLKLNRCTLSGARDAIEDRRSGAPGAWEVQELHAAEEYEARCRRAGAVDLGWIIPLALKVLRTDRTALAEWHRRARYLIVDEAHDTAPPEWALYQMLEPVELAVVGDPNQNIYRFRGTSTAFLRAAAAPPAEVVFLTQSFRSTEPVVRAANNLVSHNPEQPPEKLRSAAGSGNVNAVRSSTFAEQATVLVGVCQHYLSLGSVGLLSRTNRDLEFQVRALRGAGVTVRELTTPRAFYALPEVRAFHAHLRAVYNPHDEVATRLVLAHWPAAPAPR